MNTGTPIGIIVLLVALCLALLVVGFALRRKGMLQSQGAALGWAILTILPLAAAGGALFLKHQTDLAQGQENAQQTPSSGPATR